MSEPNMHLAGPRYHIRPATNKDVADITNVYYHSFNAPFFQYLTPATPPIRAWLNEAWEIGLDNPTDRTFVVEDKENGDKIVAFSRWMVPQQDGNQERKWPDINPSDWDVELAESFFGGMEANRRELMGARPHWMLEMLGVYEDYQNQGIAASLIKWGTDQADRDALETYLDGSAKGQPYYKKRHNFGSLEKEVFIPDRPAYGSYDYRSLVRAPQTQAETKSYSIRRGLRRFEHL